MASVIEAASVALHLPHLGLVCQTASDEVRFRTMTLSRFRSLHSRKRRLVLSELYSDNLRRLLKGLEFSASRGIRLFRMTCSAFPMSDERLGRSVLESMADDLAQFGGLAERLNIRVLMHPDQFVVINSESPKVVRTSIKILAKHALAMDLLGLPRSPWSAMIIHGGKSGRARQLIDNINTLPENIRARLALENDEFAYSASEILEICRVSQVPMIFDAHHHAVSEKLTDYEDSSIEEFTRAAASTWPDQSWQVVHISNGARRFLDPRHSELIEAFPSAFLEAPWVEVEAKGKEIAIEHLRRRLGRGITR